MSNLGGIVLIIMLAVVGGLGGMLMVALGDQQHHDSVFRACIAHNNAETCNQRAAQALEIRLSERRQRGERTREILW